MKFNDDESNLTPDSHTDALTAQQCWQLALAMLARKELSAKQLSQKLSLKGAKAEQITQVLQRCQDAHLQSDSRYADMLLRHCLHKGQGLLLVRQYFREHGINSELLTSLLDEQQIDWFTQAQLSYQRKFGATRPANDKEKLKRQAYLSRKGFSHEQVRFAIEHQDN